MKRLRIVVCWAVVAVCIQAVSIGHAAAANVCGAWVDGAGTVHIPEVNVDGAIYWATLQLEPGNDGAITLKLTDYGPAADNHCQSSQRTFYVASKGVPSAFIPSVEYAGAAYWWLLELVPSADGLLRLKVIGHGPGGEWSGEGGALLATMKIEVVKAGDLQTTLKGRSPLGLEMDLTTTLLPNQPASPPSLTHSQPAEDTYEFQLTYTVPYSALPPALVARLRAASSPLHATSDADEDNIAVVTSKAILKSQGKETLRQVVESAFGEEAAAVVRAGGKVLDVIKAWDIREKHLEQMRELDALEECAKHPAIPYFSPEDQQRVLDELASIRLEIKMGTASKFVNTMLGTAAGLTPPPMRGGIVGLVASLNKAHDEIDSRYLESARKMVTCKKKWRGTFEGTFIWPDVPGCVTGSDKVTAEVTFDGLPNADNVYPLLAGNVHVTAPSPFLRCGDIIETLSPSSYTVPIAMADLRLELFSSGHYRIISVPGASGPDLQLTTCSKSDCFTIPFPSHHSVFATMMNAEGDTVDPNVISFHDSYDLGGTAVVDWHLRRE